MKKTIGIDLGTTSISAVVLDADSGKVLEKKTIAGGTFLKTEWEWEKIQDAEEIIRKAEELIRGFCTRHPEICAIGLDCQMHGILYLDENGKALGPLYTWQDGRGDVPDENGETVVSCIHRKTGLQTASGYGMVTHLYNHMHGLVPKGAAHLCTIGDYLGMCLTGRKRPLMHVSNAASLGLFDAEKGCFVQDALQSLSLDVSILPEVTAKTEVLGLYQRLPVYTALGDNQASFLGGAGMESGRLLVNIGTGSQVSVLTDRYQNVPGMDTRPISEQRWLLVGASLCGGRAYALLEQFFRAYVQDGKEAAEQYERMQTLAEEALEKRKRTKSHQEERLQVSTLFCGTRENPAQRGSITGIGTENLTPGELILGTMEGMAEELFQMYEKTRSCTEVEVREIVMSGNGLRRNPVLQQLIAEKFGLPAGFSPYEEEAACGAAKAILETQN